MYEKNKKKNENKYAINEVTNLSIYSISLYRQSFMAYLHHPEGDDLH